MKKIAFCFRTYDNLNQLPAWERFFADADPNLYVIKVCALDPHKITQRLLLDHVDPAIHCGRPDYARTENIRTTLRMFENAFQDPHVVKAINITNSCIPLWPFSKVYEELSKSDKSYMNYVEAHKVLEDRAYINRYHFLREKNFVKWEEWIFNKPFGLVFTKELTEFFLTHDHLPLFDFKGADEHYFGNTLQHYNRWDLVERRNITRNYAIPVGLSSFNAHEMLQHKLWGYLFFRKISPHASINLDDLFVHTTNQANQQKEGH